MSKFERECIKRNRNELTKFLDEQAGITEHKFYAVYYHYIHIDKFSVDEKCLPIRVPGGTVGSIYLDDLNVVYAIHIDKNYVIKTYPEDINTLVEKFIGCKIIFEEVTNN